MGKGMRMTEAEYKAMVTKGAAASGSLASAIALGEVRPTKMNKTEAEYERIYLNAARNRGEIIAWWFEGITLKLGPDTRYTPDFPLMRSDGVIEMHEVKGGFIREDGLQKLRIAAGMYPFRFFLAQKSKGSWTVKRV